VLPDGVVLHRLTPHPDERGTFTELYRRSWELGVDPVQWNGVRSEQNVLRGVHAHWRHADYLTIVLGHATVGLHDLRPDSPAAGRAALVELDERMPASLVIPPGVAHGFFFHEPSFHVYAVSHYWDTADELGCRWDDPGLGIVWPCEAPRVSERDATLGTLDELRESVRAALAAPDYAAASP
jgi:dTDP-4-dehydrorhamnose 3,5-epimerase